MEPSSTAASAPIEAKCRSRRRAVMKPSLRVPSSEAPLLVVAVVAGPELGQGAVGGGAAGDVEAEAGLGAGDGAVGVDVPLLVGGAGAVPDDDSGAVGGALVGGVEAFVAVDGELFAGGVGPALVGAVVAVPDG